MIKMSKLLLSCKKKQFDFWENLCITHSFDVSHRLVEAGSERFFTVKNALEEMSKSDGVVAIHDAVRPMVSVATIQRCFEGARKFGNSIPVVPLTNSLRKITKNESKAVKRTNYVAVQTPQCFDLALIHEAYQQPYQDSFTDDASVLEAFGKTIVTVEGNVENIKITTPIDLIAAEYSLKI